MASKNIILRKKVEDQVYDLFLKTIASQVTGTYRDNEKDLQAILATIAGEVDAKTAQTDFDTLSKTVSATKEKLDTLMAGELDGSLDTIKEIQDYLLTHEEAYQALVKIANGKVDAVEGKSLIADELITKINDLYTKAALDQKLTEMVQATATAQAAAEAAAEAANKAVKATETNAEAITALQNTVKANGRVILSKSVPEDLTEADLLLFEVASPGA